MTEEEKKNKDQRWKIGTEKGESEIEFRNVTPKDNDEEIERYIDKIPEIFVDKYEKYLNTHKEDDELTRRYPDDFDRSIRVLPLEEKDGKRYLRMVTTDEKKTEDFHRFLKEGRFKFENDVIDGVERECVIEIIKKRIKENFRK